MWINSVTISSNVMLESDSIVRFISFYNSNGRKAGTYTYWTKNFREGWDFVPR